MNLDHSAGAERCLSLIVLNRRSVFNSSQVRFDASAITFLEQRIDAHSENLPPLKNFILPGGGPAASSLQIARCIARRAERRVIELTSVEATDSNCGIFLNRLSDYLFTAARVANAVEGGDELIYK